MNKIQLIIIAILFGLGPLGFSKAPYFKLQCNESPIQVMEQNDVPLAYGLNCYKYARVTYEGKPLALEVEALGFEFDDSDWDISPHSYGVVGEKQGNKLIVSINRVGYLVIRFSKDQDFTKRLVVFIEEPESLPEVELVDIVKTYKVDNSGAKNETAKIQRALDEIAGGDRVLYFPEGKYKTFMLRIKSDSKIHLAKNSRIIADASALDTYMADNGIGINRFILIQDAENVQVTGLGAFDGNGSEILGVDNRELVKKLDGMRLLFILNSKNISFEGIVLKDPARWNTHIMGCEDVTFRKCKMINSLINNEYFGSLDGWDPDASKRVLIEDCFGWAGDDNVAVKCTGSGNLGIYNDVEDITVRSCVFLTKKSSLKIGTETRCASMRRIVFEDNDIIEADRVMGINVRDKAVVDGVLFKNNRSEYYYPDRKQMGMNFYITRREDDQPFTGKIKNVVIEDCSFEQEFPNKIQLSRLEGYTKRKDMQVTVKNLTIANKKVSALDPDYFNISKCNAEIRFE
ncbi:MAG: glycosyl hydrolase family 28 protein [Cyclobacteriaceae bacterium]